MHAKFALNKRSWSVQRRRSLCCPLISLSFSSPTILIPWWEFRTSLIRLREFPATSEVFRSSVQHNADHRGNFRALDPQLATHIFPSFHWYHAENVDALRKFKNKATPLLEKGLLSELRGEEKSCKASQLGGFWGKRTVKCKRSKHFWPTEKELQLSL